jgi:hypothetical protein
VGLSSHDALGILCGSLAKQVWRFPVKRLGNAAVISKRIVLRAQALRAELGALKLSQLVARVATGGALIL